MILFEKLTFYFKCELAILEKENVKMVNLDFFIYLISVVVGIEYCSD